MLHHNLTLLGVPFDEAVLADEVGAYKPDPRMFAALLDRCGCTKDEIVHVAPGFYHDIMPCHALGIRRVWINRNRLARSAEHTSALQSLMRTSYAVFFFTQKLHHYYHP